MRTKGKVINRGCLIWTYGSTNVGIPAISSIGRASETFSENSEGYIWECSGSPEDNAITWATAHNTANAIDELLGEGAGDRAIGPALVELIKRVKCGPTTPCLQRSNYENKFMATILDEFRRAITPGEE